MSTSFQTDYQPTSLDLFRNIQGIRDNLELRIQLRNGKFIFEYNFKDFILMAVKKFCTESCCLVKQAENVE